MLPRPQNLRPLLGLGVCAALDLVGKTQRLHDQFNLVNRQPRVPRLVALPQNTAGLAFRQVDVTREREHLAPGVVLLSVGTLGLHSNREKVGRAASPPEAETAEVRLEGSLTLVGVGFEDFLAVLGPSSLELGIIENRTRPPLPQLEPLASHGGLVIFTSGLTSRLALETAVLVGYQVLPRR